MEVMQIGLSKSRRSRLLAATNVSVVGEVGKIVNFRGPSTNISEQATSSNAERPRVKDTIVSR
jgi:hypothetical protein